MSFTKNLGKFEDDMRTLREKRTEPGWSFCEYFMVQVLPPPDCMRHLSGSFLAFGATRVAAREATPIPLL